MASKSAKELQSISGNKLCTLAGSVGAGKSPVSGWVNEGGEFPRGWDAEGDGLEEEAGETRDLPASAESSAETSNAAGGIAPGAE